MAHVIIENATEHRLTICGNWNDSSAPNNSCEVLEHVSPYEHGAINNGSCALRFYVYAAGSAAPCDEFGNWSKTYIWEGGRIVKPTLLQMYLVYKGYDERLHLSAAFGDIRDSWPRDMKALSKAIYVIDKQIIDATGEVEKMLKAERVLKIDELMKNAIWPA